MKAKLLIATLATATAAIATPALAGELYGAIDLRAPAAVPAQSISAADLRAAADSSGELYGFSTPVAGMATADRTTGGAVASTGYHGELYGFGEATTAGVQLGE